MTGSFVTMSAVRSAASTPDAVSATRAAARHRGMLLGMAVCPQHFGEALEAGTRGLGPLAIADANVTGRTEEVSGRDAESAAIPHPRRKLSSVGNVDQPREVHAPFLRDRPGDEPFIAQLAEGPLDQRSIGLK